MRNSTGLTICLVVAASTARAQAAPASTDIYLARLTLARTRLTVGAPTNVTNRRGYDNQPSFTPDSRAMLFTSIRDDAQADTYRFELTTRTIARVTSTPESEYSPTVMPGGRRFSVVRVERDSTQRLWSFKLDGSDPRIVFGEIEPVGYPAWLDENVAALFVLGRAGRASRLLRADARNGRVDSVAADIGRTLTPLVGERGVSFAQHMPDSTWQLRTLRLDGRTGKSAVSVIGTLPRGAEYVVWVSADRALTGTGTKLLAWSRASGAWTEVADLQAAGLSRISRLAVSPDRKWLAIVAEPRVQ